MRYLKVAPSEAIAILEDEAERYELSEEQRLIAGALLTDERMSEAWAKLARAPDRGGLFALQYSQGKERGKSFLEVVLWSYQAAMHPRLWEVMTRSEQGKWMDQLDRLVADIAVHLKSSPTEADSLISYVPFEVLEQVCDESRKEGDLRNPWGVKWHLADALRLFASKTRNFAADDQWMKRPRHAKASRERFIYLLSMSCELTFGQYMQEVVAITAGVVFNDNSITARLVRRVTENLYRQDSAN